MKRILSILAAAMLFAACAPTPAANTGSGSGSALVEVTFPCAAAASNYGPFDGAAQVIDPAKDYTATIELESGEVVVDLFTDRAPITVNSFVFLSCQGFYNDLSFHRVVPGFVAQGGDPSGDMTGGPGYTIQDEHGNGLVFDQPGLLSMAHTSAANSAGSQFFITWPPEGQYAQSLRNLDGTFTIFGQVTSGLDRIYSLPERQPQPGQPAPPPGARIIRIRIDETA